MLANFLWSRFQSLRRLRIQSQASHPIVPRAICHRARLLLLLNPRMVCLYLGIVARSARAVDRQARPPAPRPACWCRRGTPLSTRVPSQRPPWPTATTPTDGGAGRRPAFASPSVAAAHVQSRWGLRIILRSARRILTLVMALARQKTRVKSRPIVRRKCQTIIPPHRGLGVRV